MYYSLCISTIVKNTFSCNQNTVLILSHCILFWSLMLIRPQVFSNDMLGKGQASMKGTIRLTVFC